MMRALLGASEQEHWQNICKAGMGCRSQEKKSVEMLRAKARAILFMDTADTLSELLRSIQGKYPLNLNHWILTLTLSYNFQKEIFCCFPLRLGICQP